LDGLGARLAGLLAPGFLALEDFLAGFAEALLVIGSAGFGRGDVGARFSIAPWVRLRRSARTATSGRWTRNV